MINVSKNVPSGALTLSALVTDGETYGAYLAWNTYFGYSIREAKKEFRAYLADTGKKLVK